MDTLENVAFAIGFMDVLRNISFVVGIIAIAIIIWGVIQGIRTTLKDKSHRSKPIGAKINALYKSRNVIGSHLLLGLEFLIAADIIRTIVKPTLQDLAILGGIVAIRTVISHFIVKEFGDEGKYPSIINRRKK